MRLPRGNAATDGLLRPDVERLLEDADTRKSTRLSDREFLGQAAISVAFLAAAVPMAEYGTGDRHVAIGTLLALVAALVLAGRVEFPVGPGYAVPTQVVFVPMLFLLPPAIIPLVVAGTTILERLPDYVSGRRHPGRVLLNLGDSWFAVGPALVFLAGDVNGVDWGEWWIWLLALAAQFALDIAASVVREWLALGVRPQRQLEVLGLVYVVDLCLAPIGLLAAVAAQERQYAFLLALPLLGLLALFAHERRVRLRQAIELSWTFRRTAMLLGDVIEDDDQYTGMHSRGVVSLAVTVADELGLDDRRRRLVELGALLHDVGKIAIPKSIINKQGPLSDDEWALMRTHTIEGQRMLERVGGMLVEVGTVVRASHERWDGGGYPDGLAGVRIPLAARIVACADAFSAMTTDRPYRAAMSRAAAVEELRECAGTHFDPAVAEATIAVVLRYGLPRQDEDALVRSGEAYGTLAARASA